MYPILNKDTEFIKNQIWMRTRYNTGLLWKYDWQLSPQHVSDFVITYHNTFIINTASFCTRLYGSFTLSLRPLGIQQTRGKVDIPLTALSPPHLCACFNLGPGFLKSYVVVFLEFSKWRWKVIVRSFCLWFSKPAQLTATIELKYCRN